MDGGVYDGIVPDELASGVDLYVVFVSKMRSPILFHPPCVDIFLAAFRQTPPIGFEPLLDLLVFIARIALLR